LICDDDVAQAEMAQEFLRISGFEQIEHVTDLRGMWRQLKQHDYDIVLLDYMLPDGTGVEALGRFPENGYSMPVIIVTGQGSERIAVQALQHGAADYLMKTGDYLITLPALIHKTLQAHQLQLSIQRSLDQIRYQALLLNNVRDAIVVWNMNGIITYWNPAATLLFGWSDQERLGRPVAESYLQTFTPVVAPPKETDTTGRHLIRKTLNRQGKTIWVSSQVTALRDTASGDSLIGYMDVSHDITLRVEAENALRESESRYRAIVEDYQTEMICRFKANGTLTFVNEVFCRTFGKSREELMGMNYLYFLPEGERNRLVQHLLSFGANRSVGTMEHQIHLPGQGLRWMQRTDRAILDERGRIFEFQSVQRDVTDRKRLEAQVLAAQSHLVQAARLATIGEMASGVAHQIYNPLTTIIADAQLLMRSLPDDKPERESAEAIEQAGWRLQQVVQRLMEFSRPSSESQLLISIDETLQTALSMVSHSIEETGCRLEVKLSQEEPVVRGNSRQLENLWVNLLLLARDACMDGKEHTISVRSQVHSQLDSPGVVIVEVSDNGRHIPAEQLATIFEPNFVGPTSGRGTGMELSICREIVRQHAGQITADSQPGRDTIFRVALPVEAA
jgi:PAS domain S-box-containing protein